MESYRRWLSLSKIIGKLSRAGSIVYLNFPNGRGSRIGADVSPLDQATSTSYQPPFQTTAARPK